MSKLIRNLAVLLFLPLFIFFAPVIYANHIPAPTGHVNDFAGVLTPDQKIALENSLRDYEQRTANEIAIAIVKSLNGGDITDFTVRAFEEWKVGKKGRDNGVLFLAAIDDRKMRIEVGYGLEPYLTDSQAGEIIRDEIAPNFGDGNYYQGINKGVNAIESRLDSSSPLGQATNTAKGFGNKLLELPIDGLATIFIFIMYLLSYMARTKSIWLGGIVGIGAGAFWGLIATSLVTGVIASMVLGGLGLLLDWSLSKVYRIRVKNRRSTGWWASGGGFSTGRGFGGFGGGRSGGGGASGSW